MITSIAYRAARICTLALCIAWSNCGRAETDSKRRCVLAYEDAQTSKRKGRLLEAKDKLLLCSSHQCPELMHGDCQRWLDEVEASMPSVVFRVETSQGSAVGTASASVDGGADLELRGRALNLDPGRHSVRVWAKGFLPREVTLEVTEGEKLRREIVVLDPIDPVQSKPEAVQQEPPRAAPRPPPARMTWPIVFSASAAVLGGVGATYFGLTARAGERDLDACSPNCSHQSVDRVKRDYLVANTSLGLAGVGLVVTTVLLVLEFRSPHGSQYARLGVATSQDQLALSLGGNF